MQYGKVWHKGSIEERSNAKCGVRRTLMACGYFGVVYRGAPVHRGVHVVEKCVSMRAVVCEQSGQTS